MLPLKIQAIINASLDTISIHVNMCSSCKHFIYGIPFWSTLRWTGPQMGDDVADKADNSADEMGDDAAQTPRSVADKADNSADGSIIEISNHTVDTVLYLPVCRDWQNNMCSVLGLQFVKGNRDHNAKPLDIVLWTKLLVYVVALKVMGIAFLEL